MDYNWRNGKNIILDKLVDVKKASECWGIFVWEANHHYNLEWLDLFFKINFLISINTEKVFSTYSFDLTKVFSLLSLSHCSLAPFFLCRYKHKNMPSIISLIIYKTKLHLYATWKLNIILKIVNFKSLAMFSRVYIYFVS